jgi:Ran GTPase-activating protein (RanGAP) involved in mRNA processing and transport
VVLVNDRVIKHFNYVIIISNIMTSYQDESKSRFVAQANDPTVTSLTVNRGDWDKRAGQAIGDSETIRELVINMLHRETDCTWFGELLPYLLRNRSITKLSIIFISIGVVGYKYNLQKDIFRSLIPFIEHNNNLVYIEFACGPISMLRSLSYALSSCKNKRLERIDLRSIQNEGDDREFYYGEFFASLNGYNNLSHVRVVNCKIGTDGVTKLSNLLKKPASSICRLDLEKNSLNDEHTTILGNGVIGNKNLTSISLWVNPSITAVGWDRFSQTFVYPECALQTLQLRYTNLDDEGVTFIGNALTMNKSIKSLCLTGNDAITSEGLRGLLQCMRNPDSSLEDLTLSNCGVDDEGVTVIMEKVVQSVSLKTLDLSCNGITSTGLIMIIDALFYYELTLEAIDLSGNHGIHDELEDEDRLSLLRVLCDKSSINDTFLSNHTLQSIILDGYSHYDWPERFWEDLDYLLNMNDNENKVEVAREKILNSHFTGEAVDIGVFARMPEALLPHAIEWIGRDRLGFSLMYQFVGGYPLDFSDYNSSRAAKKLKHSS